MAAQMSLSLNYLDIAEFLSISEFERIKEFVLTKGDRQSFRNFDNNNPHYNFGRFDVYLGSDIGQQNMDNDPNLSDFNQLTIFDPLAEVQYYEIIAVRKGAVEAAKCWIWKGMEEGKVYLTGTYNKGINRIKEDLENYLRIILSVVN